MGPKNTRFGVALQPGQEWWRKKAAYAQHEKDRLAAYIAGRQRYNAEFQGSQRYLVEIIGNKVYAWKSRGSPGLSITSAKTLVGKLYGKYTVLHAKRAPRWLRNWARWRPDVFVLPKLDRGTLASHLMVLKLRDSIDAELPF